jgi:hypothetical protein
MTVLLAALLRPFAAALLVAASLAVAFQPAAAASPHHASMCAQDPARGHQDIGAHDHRSSGHASTHPWACCAIACCPGIPLPAAESASNEIFKHRPEPAGSRQMAGVEPDGLLRPPRK